MIPSARFCINVVVSKQVKNKVAVLASFGSAIRIKITEQPILLTKCKINCQGYKFSKNFR